MGKIIFLMGKSSTGKDTVFKELLKEGTLDLKTIVPYTTRPIRLGEQDGMEYIFTDEKTFQQLYKEGKVIEDREYDTFYGLWRYYTVDDGQLDLTHNNYIVIGTLESYRSMQAYYGTDKLVPVMIVLDDGIRLQRALDRERQEEHPKYEELCRRFLADSEDFSSEKIKEAGINNFFYNIDLETCLKEIVCYIRTVIMD